MKRLIPLVASAFLASCIHGAQAPSKPMKYVADWDAKQEGAEWTAFTLAALRAHGAELSTGEPADLSKYCPKYRDLNRQERDAFWLGLLSTMARFESSFKPETQYQERFNDRNGRPVISRGLLQLSKESANGSRYRCGIGDASELHDPRTNLTCGVKIMNALVARDGVIGTKQGGRWLGGAAYWSVLRATSGSNYKIRAFTNEIEVCRE